MAGRSHQPELPGVHVSLGEGPRVTRAEERRLLAAARKGDSRAISRLVTLLTGPIYRFGRSFCGDDHDAEDVTQMVLLALTRTLSQFRGDSSLTTWAYTVARHACARHRRRRAGAPTRLETLEKDGRDRGALGVEDPSQDPHRALERTELARALREAIQRLPPAHREVVVLRDIEGLSAQEVGEVLELGERAVKSRLHRARLALRAALEPWAEGLGVRAGRSRSRRRDCPDTARLVSRYLEGELTAEACRTLQRHVSECADCGAACDSLRFALDSCRAWRGRPVPSDVAASVREAMRQVIARQPAGRPHATKHGR